MDVWIVRALCGDYYCGCGGGHLVGIYSTESLAQEALTKARDLKWENPHHKEGTLAHGPKTYNVYDIHDSFGSTIEAVEVDAPPRDKAL